MVEPDHHNGRLFPQQATFMDTVPRVTPQNLEMSSERKPRGQNLEGTASQFTLRKPTTQT
jgi:hypothetical protein